MLQTLQRSNTCVRVSQCARDATDASRKKCRGDTAKVHTDANHGALIVEHYKLCVAAVPQHPHERANATATTQIRGTNVQKSCASIARSAWAAEGMHTRRAIETVDKIMIV